MGSKSKGKKDKARVESTPSTAGRTPRLTTIVPVRFEPATLDAVRARADADGRSVSAWIRRLVQLELDRVGAGDAARDSDASTRSG